jgi:ABC-type nitrate/sulfonate/bicarbonate transport system substrate-binding protein
MAFIAKGLPAKAIAASAGPPRELVLVVRTDLPDIKSAADLKGRTIGVTGPSLTGWLVTNMSNMQGWGPKGIKQNYAQPPASWALLKTKQIDGMVSDLGTALQAQREGLGRILLNFGDQLTDFHVHVILATDTAIREKPDMLRRFLAAWFETIAFMRAHKAETVAISKGIQDLDADLAAQVYDQAMPEFSADGRFDPKALAVLAQSYVDLDVLPAKPDMSTLYTEALLPAAH